MGVVGAERERDRPVKGNESTDSITLRAHGCLNEQQGRGERGHVGSQGRRDRGSGGIDRNIVWLQQQQQHAQLAKLFQIPFPFYFYHAFCSLTRSISLSSSHSYSLSLAFALSFSSSPCSSFPLPLSLLCSEVFTLCFALL